MQTIRRFALITGTLALMIILIMLSGRLFKRDIIQPLTPPILPLPTADNSSMYSGGNGLIAFESTRDGNPEIYVMSAEGAHQKNITNNPAWDVSPKWSPGGQRLAFISNRTGKPGIFVMDAQGAQVQQLTNDPEAAWGGVRQNGKWYWSPDSTNLSWSPDGTRLVVTRVLRNPADNGWTESRIYLVNTDGSGSVPLTDGDGHSDDFRPYWAPDGKHIAFLRQQYNTLRIIVVNPDGTGEVDLGTSYPFFDWSPDGTRLAYFVSSANKSQDEIWVTHADGSNGKMLLKSERRLVSAQTTLVWSPDGTRLVFVAPTLMNGQFTWQLYLIWSDGSGLTPVPSPLADHYMPVWSSDSQWIAFAAQQGTATDIYTLTVKDVFRSPENLNAVQLTNTGKEHNPQWQP